MDSDNKQDIRNKMENLDNELDTFFQAVREIKELRDTIGEMPEKLIQSQEELEGQKKEMKRLMVSTKNLFTRLEDHAKDILIDMEKKSDGMKGEVREGILRMDEGYREEFDRLRDEYREKFEEISKKIMHVDRYNDAFSDKRITSMIDEKNTGGNNLMWVGVIILLVSTAIAVAAFYLR